MNRFQDGGVTNALLLVLIVVVLLVWASDKMPASSGDVQSLVATAGQSHVAQQMLKEGLEKTPVPTRQELRAIEQRVSQQLVLEQSRAVTGNPSLSPGTVPDSSLAGSPSETDSQAEILLVWLLKIGMGLMAIWLPLMVWSRLVRSDAILAEDALHLSAITTADRREGLRGETRLVTMEQANAMVAAERERICAAIKSADDKSVDEAGYMLDSTDCISIVRGTWPNNLVGQRHSPDMGERETMPRDRTPAG